MAWHWCREPSRERQRRSSGWRPHGARSSMFPVLGHAPSADLPTYFRNRCSPATAGSKPEALSRHFTLRDQHGKRLRFAHQAHDSPAPALRGGRPRVLRGKERQSTTSRLVVGLGKKSRERRPLSPPRQTLREYRPGLDTSVFVVCASSLPFSALPVICPVSFVARFNTICVGRRPPRSAHGVPNKPCADQRCTPSVPKPRGNKYESDQLYESVLLSSSGRTPTRSVSSKTTASCGLRLQKRSH